MQPSAFYRVLFIFILTSSCNKNISVSGEYEVKTKTLKDRFFLHNMKSGGRIVGSSLSLAPDSTFFYRTCGNEMTGRWIQVNDSILLFVETNTFRNDSLQAINVPFIPGAPLSFKIRYRQLYRNWETPDAIKIIELLTKND